MKFLKLRKIGKKQGKKQEDEENDEINDAEEEKMRRKKSFHISQAEPPQQAPRSRTRSQVEKPLGRRHRAADKSNPEGLEMR